MISRVQAQCCNTQSFKAKGSIAKNALSDLHALTAAREADGIADLALRLTRRGFNIDSINAFPECGAPKILASKNGVKKTTSMPSFILKKPSTISDEGEVVKRYNASFHQLDTNALKNLERFVAVA